MVPEIQRETALILLFHQSDDRNHAQHCGQIPDGNHITPCDASRRQIIRHAPHIFPRIYGKPEDSDHRNQHDAPVDKTHSKKNFPLSFGLDYIINKILLN